MAKNTYNAERMRSPEMRFCTRCGIVLEGKARKYCPECAQATKHGKRKAPARGAEDMAAVVSGHYGEDGRLVAGATGADGGGTGNPSPTGAWTIENGRAVPPGAEAREVRTSVRKGSTGFCLICGRVLKDEQVRYCDGCKRTYTSRAAKKLAVLGRPPTQEEMEYDAWLQNLRRQAERRCRLTADEISRFAGLYDRPYNSYGKLRAYIDEHDELPDPKYLKKNTGPWVDWQADPRDRG